MNGMAAADKIFRLLELPEAEENQAKFRGCYDYVRDHSFSYEPSARFSMALICLFKGSFTALVGESGWKIYRCLHPYGTQKAMRGQYFSALCL